MYMHTLNKSLFPGFMRSSACVRACMCVCVWCVRAGARAYVYVVR